MKKIKANLNEKESVTMSDSLFGVNIENIGRVIYDGIYNKNSKKSDEHGFREDVALALKELKPSFIRWPGGNFCSGYHWRDGIGKNRPVRLNLAWQQTEPNIIGLHEMAEYANKIGSKLFMNINAGHDANMQESLDLVEYCNLFITSIIA